MSLRTGARRAVLAMLLSLGLAGSGAWAQELPPPDVKVKPKPKPRAGKSGGGTGGGTTTGAGGASSSSSSSGGSAPAAAPVLLLSAEFACSFAVDGDAVPQALKAQELRRINVSPGQHLLSCMAQGGAMRWQKTVEAKPGQQVVEIKMSEAALSSGEDFDKAIAGVWLGISDLRTAGDYVSSIVQRSWGFHDPGLSTALHTADEYLKQKVEDMKRLAPGNPTRRKVVDDCTRVAGIAAQYVDLMTKAISEAQKANSWLGNPQDMFAQARALEPSIVFPGDALPELKQSKAFAEALPLDRRPELGLPGDTRDFQLGARTYQGMPNVLAVVTKNGLADKMGFKSGDRVLAVNGQTVPSVWDFKLALRQNAGKSVKVTIDRDGKEQQRDMKVPGSL